MSDSREPRPARQIFGYRREDGRTKLDVFDDEELEPATVRRFRTVRWKAAL